MQFSFTLHGGIEMPAIGYGTYSGHPQGLYARTDAGEPGAPRLPY